MILRKSSFFSAYAAILARSAAVVSCVFPSASASSPFGVIKLVPRQPSERAFSFIRCAKAGTLPSIYSAIATAVSLCDSNIREYNRSSRRNLSPFCMPSFTLGMEAACPDTSTGSSQTVVSCSFIYSSARMQVMIFVVEAIGSFS